MPKKSESATEQPAPQTFTVSTINKEAVPPQKRLGRTSKFTPLLERLKNLDNDEALSFGIQKYTQIQGLRSKLEKLGFVITTRSNRDASGNVSLMAYVYHAPTESEKS